jgi:release factor glutamine methyltransferase
MFARLKQSLSVWLIKKVQRYGPQRVRVLGNIYEISEEVFNPGYYYTSKFMAKHIKVKPEDIVLDMGTGSGIQAITAAHRASKVIAIDINPVAVRFARKNVRANGLENIVSVIEGDLFSPLYRQRIFSVIFFTPPYMDGTPKTNFDKALFDSNKGLVERFFNEAKEYIKSDGYIQMIYSSIAKPEQVLRISRQLGWDHKLIAQEKTFMERFLIYRLTLI